MRTIPGPFIYLHKLHDLTINMSTYNHVMLTCRMLTKKTSGLHVLLKSLLPTLYGKVIKKKKALA